MSRVARPGNRCPFAVIAVVVGVVASAPRASAQFVPVVYETPRTAEAPAIDGRLDDAPWRDVAPVTPFYKYRSGGEAALADTTLRLLWDDRFLYVAMSGSDDDLRSACQRTGDCDHDTDIYHGDVFELFLRESVASPRYFEFEWSPTGADFDARFDTRQGAPGRAWESGMLSAVVVDGTIDNPADDDRGWSVEVRIPLAGLTEQPVHAGTVWTFAGARYDYANRRAKDGVALMMSSKGDPTAPQAGMGEGFHSYEVYDTLRFVELAAE